MDSIGRLVLIIVLSSFCASDLLADLTVQSYSADRNDRFANSSSFIGNPYDWSGVGLTSGNRWVTMISPSYFLSATHNQPLLNESVTFFNSNDPAAPPSTFTIVAGTQIAGTDLWLGKLNASTSVASYAVTDAFSLNTGQEIFLFGLASGYSPGQGLRLGRNTVDGMVDGVQLTGSQTDTFIYDYDPVGGVGADEAKVETGDSGGPSFIIVNGQPVLVGIHWFQFSGAPEPLAPTGSGDSYVSRYLDDISPFLIGEQLTIVSVPEPSSLILLGLSAGVPWVVRRVRQKRA